MVLFEKEKAQKKEADREECCITLGVEFAGDVLASDHSVSLEPFAAELLGGALRSVRPLDGDAVVVGVLRLVVERVAADGDHGRLLRVETAGGRLEGETLGVGRLESESDPAGSEVGDADVVDVLFREGRVPDELEVRLGQDVSGGDGRHVAWLESLVEKRPIGREQEAKNDSKSFHST